VEPGTVAGGSGVVVVDGGTDVAGVFDAVAVGGSDEHALAAIDATAMTSANVRMLSRGRVCG